MNKYISVDAIDFQKYIYTYGTQESDIFDGKLYIDLSKSDAYLYQRDGGQNAIEVFAKNGIPQKYQKIFIRFHRSLFKTKGSELITKVKVKLHTTSRYYDDFCLYGSMDSKRPVFGFEESDYIEPGEIAKFFKELDEQELLLPYFNSISEIINNNTIFRDHNYYFSELQNVK